MNPSKSEIDWELTGASNVAAQLSSKEKLKFLVKALAITTPRVLWSITYDVAFRPCEVLSRPFRMTLLKCALQKVDLTIREQRALWKPTGVCVANYCASKKLSHEKVLLANTDAGTGGYNKETNCGDEGRPTSSAYELRPAMLHFIGRGSKARTTAKRVLIYFHGGGYFLPLTTGQLRFAERAAREADANLVVLEYTLVPQLKYPGQLAQGAAAVRYLLKTWHASDIIIAGDSAGANMCLSILAHMREPHPLVEPIFPKGTPAEKLLGALVISPRCANSNNSASFTYNNSRDIISGRSMDSVAEKWGTEMEDVWAVPLQGGKEFWKDVMVNRMLLTAGENEVYVDDVKDFAAMMGAKDRIEQANCPYELVVSRGEFHVQAVLDVALAYNKGIMLEAVLDWLRAI